MRYQTQLKLFAKSSHSLPIVVKDEEMSCLLTNKPL